MISAWRKLVKKGELADGQANNKINGNNSSNPNGAMPNYPPGCQKLNRELQRKFARGVNYNLKLVIKGDAKVGKSCLFMRLQGKPFEHNYEPTENLNVTSIDWSYKTTDDIIKIDIWEVVDGLSAKKMAANMNDLKLNATSSSLSLTNGQSVSTEQQKSQSNGTTNFKLSMNNNSKSGSIPEKARQSLAEFKGDVDVYRGTDVVILLMDMTKLWTYKFVQNELPKIPKQIPVLVVANFRDQGHHRCITAEQVQSFIETLDRSPCDGIVMYMEASMKNGFGLKLIERFLNIPFLRSQEMSLLKQLELNRQEFMTTVEELNLMRESINIEYEQYLELQTITRRQQADAISPVNLGPRQLDEAMREQIRNSSASSDLVDNRNAASVKSIESNPNNSEKSAAQVAADKNFVNNRLPSIVIGAKCPLPETKAFQMGPASVQNHKDSRPAQVSPELEESEDSNGEEDDNEPRANPLVAGYQSDLDPDDQ